MRIPDRHALDHAPTMQPVVLALGSNLGSRGELLKAAVEALRTSSGIVVDAVSPVVETVALKPEGRDSSAPRYLNAVVLAHTLLTPEALLAEAHHIEDEHGRVRDEVWGDRTLDIDIVDYAGLSSDDPELTLPHPRAHERDFVLAPWAAVDPDAVLPGKGRVADLLAALGDASCTVEGISL